MTIFSNAVNKTKHYVLAEGKLQEITFNYIECYPTTETYTIDANIGGKHKRLEVDSLPQLFDNEEDYRKGKASTDITTELAFHAKNTIGDTYNADKFYYVDDNTIKSTLVGAMDIHYDYTDHPYYVGQDDITYYASRDLLMLCRDIKVVDAEGNETISKSLVSRMQLTDKQQELWERFIAICEEMEENNLNILFDEDGETMYAVGGEELTTRWSKRNPDFKDITMDSDAFADVMPSADIKAMTLYCNLHDSEEVYLYHKKN